MPSLGLAMIVKNGAKTLPDSLASVASVTHQIVIADTGSTDGTQQVALDLGAEVFDFPWQDDFAQARNAAIRALATDWVLVIDDDEELDPQARDKIPPLLAQARVGGYFFTQRNYLPVSFGAGGRAAAVKPNHSSLARAQAARGYADFASCRLFRRHPEIYYVGRVHERVEQRIPPLGLELASTSFLIHHFGHLSSAATLRKKDELYRKLGRLKLEDAPHDPQAWIEMGLQEYEQFKHYSAGIACFQKALALDPQGSTVPYLSLANLFIEIRDEDRALELLAAVAMTGRAAGVKEDIRGDAFYNLGRLPEARSAYLRALRIIPADALISSKVGLTEARLGLKKSGLARLTRALRTNPGVYEVHDRMIKACILLNMLPQAAEAADRLAAALPNPATLLRAASIRAQMEGEAVVNRAAESRIDRRSSSGTQNRERC